MTKLSIKSDKLTSVIERKVIQAGAEGITTDKLMQAMKIGRTCARNHLHALESSGRIYHVLRTRPSGGGIVITYHPGSKQTSGASSARRDWLVEAFFGPACKEQCPC